MIVSTNIAKASASDQPIVGSIMVFLGDLGNIWKPMAWCYDVLWLKKKNVACPVTVTQTQMGVYDNVEQSLDFKGCPIFRQLLAPKPHWFTERIPGKY